MIPLQIQCHVFVTPVPTHSLFLPPSPLLSLTLSCLSLTLSLSLSLIHFLLLCLFLTPPLTPSPPLPPSLPPPSPSSPPSPSLPLSLSPDGTLLFEALNLNSQASWYSDQPEGRPLNVLCLQQLEKDTIFIGMDRILHTPMQPCHIYVCCVAAAVGLKG